MKVNVCVGESILVDVCKPKFGRFPIGRHRGLICILNLPESIRRLEYGCTVMAKVAIIKERSLVVLVEEVVVSAAKNELDMIHTIDDLKDKYSKKLTIKSKKNGNS